MGRIGGIGWGGKGDIESDDRFCPLVEVFSAALVRRPVISMHNFGLHRIWLGLVCICRVCGREFGKRSANTASVDISSTDPWTWWNGSCRKESFQIRSMPTRQGSARPRAGLSTLRGHHLVAPPHPTSNPRAGEEAPPHPGVGALPACRGSKGQDHSRAQIESQIPECRPFQKKSFGLTACLP